jgi:hypothetical protein
VNGLPKYLWLDPSNNLGRKQGSSFRSRARHSISQPLNLICTAFMRLTFVCTAYKSTNRTPSNTGAPKYNISQYMRITLTTIYIRKNVGKD